MDKTINKPMQAEMPFAIVQGEQLTELPKDLYIPPVALQVFLEATWMHAVCNTLCGCRFVVQIMFRRLTPGARRPVRPKLEVFCLSTVDYDAHLGVVCVRFLPLGDARHAYS